MVSGEALPTRAAFRRRLVSLRPRATRPLLWGVLRKLKLVKTPEAYRRPATISEEVPPLPPLARALREFLIDVRPAENLLVLKTPPSGAQPLAAAVDASKFPEIAGTIAGDDTVLIITPSRKTRAALQQKTEALLKS